MIVKIQRALYPPDGPALIYNQDHSFEMQLQLSPAVIALMGDDVIIYAEIQMDAERIVVVDVLEPQPW